jgi:hypothetical protein
MTKTRCPRCTNPYDPGQPARSRVTLSRDIPICPPCGTDEAVRDAAGRAPIPPSEWPLTAA